MSSSQWGIPCTNIFFSPTHKCHDKTPNQEEEENITVNIYSCNLNGSNTCDLWVIKRMHSTAGESEFNYLQQNTCEWPCGVSPTNDKCIKNVYNSFPICIE